MKELIGSIIKNQRLNKGLTQVELALRLGVSTSYISQIESGTRGMHVDMMFEIFRELEIKVSIQNRNYDLLCMLGG